MNEQITGFLLCNIDSTLISICTKKKNEMKKTTQQQIEYKTTEMSAQRKTHAV